MEAVMTGTNPEILDMLAAMGKACEIFQRGIAAKPVATWSDEDEFLNNICGGYLFLYYVFILKLTTPDEHFQKLWGGNMPETPQ
jgi:hypothetical protein